jgi:Leucine-rich repeat (LRR) protein
MRFISQLYLDGNHLLSLSGIEQFLNLEVLHIDYNYISIPSEIDKINNPFFMQELSFIGNPI